MHSVVCVHGGVGAAAEGTDHQNVPWLRGKHEQLGSVLPPRKGPRLRGSPYKPEAREKWNRRDKWNCRRGNKVRKNRSARNPRESTHERPKAVARSKKGARDACSEWRSWAETMQEKRRRWSAIGGGKERLLLKQKAEDAKERAASRGRRERGS